MITTGEGAMDAYSGLEESEKRKFDKKYRQLDQFRRWMNHEAGKWAKRKSKAKGNNQPRQPQ